MTDTPWEVAMLRIAFSDHDIEQLRYERYHHPHPRVQQKMEALLLKSQNLPHQVIAGCVGVCENTLLAYFRAYHAGGIQALKQVNFYRPASELETHRTSLEAYFREHPPTTIAEAAAVIERLTGIQRKPTQVRVFLRKLGLKRLKTYAVPDKTDTERQDAFKKTRSNRVLQKHKPDNAQSFL
jgi:transposase